MEKREETWDKEFPRDKKDEKQGGQTNSRPVCFENQFSRDTVIRLESNSSPDRISFSASISIGRSARFMLEK